VAVSVALWNVNADYIARWDGAQWHPLGGGLNSTVLALAVSGGQVYVGGWFTDAGGPRTPITSRAGTARNGTPSAAG
ncbi:MAG: hypothetical protein RMN25_14795, partial [Anaerolineae bacterium]|nr:hypothetical protein [Thermoflexales bacterium]MDW8409040.1 hypothetical protein [Anaerolineae bacterium]